MPGQAKKSIVKDDILFSEIRPINRRFAFINFSCLDYVVSTKFMVVKAYQNLIIPKYLYTYLTNQDSLNTFQSIAESRSGTFPQITFDSIKHLDLNLPPLEEQGRIVDIASCLDAKIENLRRQNETLEQIAQTLFKHWFIDFEFPNADGKPYKSSGGAMITSELGDIPEGWKVGILGDIYKTTSGGTPSRTELQYYFQGTIPWVKSKELYSIVVLDTEEKITELGLKNSSAKLLPKNSILVAMYGATVGQVSILGIEATCNQAICAILEQEYSNFFAYLWLNLKKKEWSGMAIGSAQQNLSQVLILKIDVVIPSIELVKYFHSLVFPLFQKIVLNENQIQTLTKTRDSVLPKLMSGQLRIKE